MTATTPAAEAATEYPGDHRTRPRRRGPVLEAAILDAVIEELEQSGYDELSIDSVARRAGVGKASVYRRWPGKTELIIGAVYRRLPDPVDLPDTGSLRDDLVAAMTQIAEQLAGPAGAALRGMLGDALRKTDGAERFRSQSQGRSLALMTEIVRRADERGELDAAALSRPQLESGLALVRHQFLFSGGVPQSAVIQIVDDVMLPVFLSVNTHSDADRAAAPRSAAGSRR